MRLNVLGFVALAGSLSLTAGCGGIGDPYVPSPRLQEIVQRGQPDPNRTPSTRPPRDTGQIQYALWYIGELRTEMERRHEAHSGGRIGLTAGAFGAAVGGAAGGLFGFGRDLVTGIALGGTSAAAGANLFLDRGMSGAYSAGSEALDCLYAQGELLRAVYVAANRARWRAERLSASTQQSGRFPGAAASASEVLLTLSALRMEEARDSTRLRSAAQAIRHRVNAEIRRYEPDPNRAAAASGQIAASAQAVTLANLRITPEFRAQARAARQSLVGAQRNGIDPGTIPAERPEADPPENATTAGVEAAEIAPAHEVRLLLIEMDTLLGSLEAGPGSLPTCSVSLQVPITGSLGRMVTMARNDTQVSDFTGGSGRYEVTPLIPLPAGLTVSFQGARLTIRTDATVPIGAYAVTIRDLPGASGERSQEYTIVIHVSGTARRSSDGGGGTGAGSGGGTGTGSGAGRASSNELRRWEAARPILELQSVWRDSLGQTYHSLSDAEKAEALARRYQRWREARLAEATARGEPPPRFPTIPDANYAATVIANAPNLGAI